MKMTTKEYQEIKHGIKNKGIEKVKEYKKQLKELQLQNKVEINDFDTRFIFDVYYSCTPSITKIKIADNKDYKDSHIKTATKKALTELGIL